MGSMSLASVHRDLLGTALLTGAKKSALHFTESALHFTESALHFTESALHFTESALHFTESAFRTDFACSLGCGNRSALLNLYSWDTS
jgi:hypothetical protein